MIEVTRTNGSKEAIEKASLRLNQILDAHSNVPILLLSAGGSAMALLDLINIFPSNFTVGMTDERFSEDSKVNNFAQLCETSFFQKAEEHNSYFIDTRVQDREDLEVFTKRFESALVNWHKEHPGGKIIITQGVGSDGHTVGIMPYPGEEDTFGKLFDSETLVMGYDAGNKNKYSLRATITLPFLRMVDYSVLYMVGKEKKDAMSRMLKPTGTLTETPARIIHEMKEVYIFTDIQ